MLNVSRFKKSYHTPLYLACAFFILLLTITSVFVGETEESYIARYKQPHCIDKIGDAQVKYNWYSKEYEIKFKNKYYPITDLKNPYHINFVASIPPDSVSNHEINVSAYEYVFPKFLGFTYLKKYEIFFAAKETEEIKLAKCKEEVELIE